MGALGRTEGGEGQAVEDTGDSRANIWCKEDLHRELKVRAAQQGVTLRELVEGYLSQGLKADKNLGVMSGGQGEA